MRIKKEIKDGIDKIYKEKYDYKTWLRETLCQELTSGPFPANQREEELLQLLTLELSYKQNFKSACDDEHPIVIEQMENMQIEFSSIERLIELTKTHNPEILDFYLLFQEDIKTLTSDIDGVLNTVDKLSQDARFGSIVSHPSKMTNPECRFPRIFVHSVSSKDGFVRTGNCRSAFDMHINAVNLKVFKFLSLMYKNQSLLEYIKANDTTPFKELFKVGEDKARHWVENFSVCLNAEDKRTHKNIRQVYFPTDNNKKEYHLLSLLTPSGLVFFLKDKIDHINMRSSNSYLGKKRRKEDKYYELRFSTVPNLTMIRHGGDHPKNISGLNNKGQTYYLLPSIPPKPEKRDTRFPKKNFFRESIRDFEHRDIFHALHNLFKTDYNNHSIREGRDYRIQSLIDLVIDRMWAVRAICMEQYRADKSNLKLYQKKWLCGEYVQLREEEDDWLDSLCKDITSWIILTYQRLLGKNAYKLGEAERLHIHQIVNKSREALR